VSTDVFAAIRAMRQDGENTEDEILRRMLVCAGKSGPTEQPLTPTTKGGVYDTRNEVHFLEGFGIFRTYKRREYSAVARDAFWLTGRKRAEGT